MKTEYKLFLIASLILIVVIIFIINLPAESLNEQTYTIASEEDDGRTFETIGDVGFDNEPDAWANLEVNPSYSFGLRFTNISIPKNACIKEARIKLFSIGIPDRHDVVNCTIYADDVDSAQNFTVMGCLNRSGRTYSNNSIVWHEQLPYNRWVTTPDITQIIQEIINRDGWKQGNNIALLFITFNSLDSAVFENYDMGRPAELSIEWK